MLKKFSIQMMLVASAMVATASMAAEDPTLHQVYQAAQAGKLGEAQTMMTQVLHDHPNSAKAHFVEAELLGKQGRLANAESELNTAERLAPGLPFAKPQTVQNLKNRIAQTHVTSNFMPATVSAGSGGAGELPWGMILIGIGVIAAIMFAIRSMNRNNTSVTPFGGGARYGASYPSQPYGTNGMAPPMGQSGGGLGSGIMGGLATGAAMGAGIVAGEALMHHFTDGNRQNVNPAPSTDNAWNTAQDDMGGTDFGIADNASWDDSSSGGDNGWDS
jgi:uncharacterized protein